MNRKRRSAPVREPYWWTDKVVPIDEFYFKGRLLMPGDKLKFKGTRGVFTFERVWSNTEKDVQWINCLEDKTQQFRAFYVDRLSSIVIPKKSRRKKDG